LSLYLGTKSLLLKFLSPEEFLPLPPLFLLSSVVVQFFGIKKMGGVVYSSVFRSLKSILCAMWCWWVVRGGVAAMALSGSLSLAHLPPEPPHWCAAAGVASIEREREVRGGGGGAS
jgi:hypothetical protein